MATRRRQTAVFGKRRALEPVTGVMILVISLCMASTSRESHAASRDAERPPARLMVAQADQQDFAIPAQPLGQALTQFGIQTNYRVLYNADVTEGRSTGGVSGRYSAEEALSRLLEGTGVTHTKTNPKEITLRTMEPSGAAGAIVPGAAAGAAAANGPKDEEPLETREVIVKGVKPRKTAELNNLPPEYPGGQVARGGRVGMLGNRDIMDTPLTQMNYTSKLIEDQQARFLTDVLQNDPSVQLTQPASVGFQQFNIRGFGISPNAQFFNGFLGITPSAAGTMMTESIERVEVLRGPSALLNGATPLGGATGGIVNLMPKRAGEEALTRLTAQYISDSQVGGHVDLSRRFGSHKQFGVRINGAYRNGDLPIDHASRESAMVSIGLDYRSDVVRLAADFGYQEQDERGMRRQLSVLPDVTALPEPPDTRINQTQPWDFIHGRDLYGTLRGEVDVTEQITAFAGFGILQSRSQQILTGSQIIDSQGTLAAGSAFLGLSAFTRQVVTFDAGLRSAFDTGPIHHQAVAAYTQYALDARNAFSSPVPFPASNLYHPVFGPAPSSSQPGYGDTRKAVETGLSSAMLGDTLSILDERVQLTAGVRFQQIKQTNFNLTTGAVTASYDKSAATPMVGLVVKPWQQVSLYANYIEGLQQGPTAPLFAANAGEVFPPFVSKGYEAGVKADFGRIATTLAAFQITQPFAFINPATNVFGVDGEQRNRGVEFNIFGEVMEGLRLLGGTSYIDAELTKTEGGVNQGNKAPALPFQLILYGEWDLPFLKALTLTSRVTHASSQYINEANTQKIRDWTQWDLGARYRYERANGKSITIRAFLENALDTNAWAGSFSGSVLVRDPRTFLLSAMFDF
ncbi:MAG: TonB-dependent siderophore receptor [Nitrospira sp.]